MEAVTILISVPLLLEEDLFVDNISNISFGCTDSFKKSDKTNEFNNCKSSNNNKILE